MPVFRVRSELVYCPFCSPSFWMSLRETSVSRDSVSEETDRLLADQVTRSAKSQITAVNLHADFIQPFSSEDAPVEVLTSMDDLDVSAMYSVKHLKLFKQEEYKLRQHAPKEAQTGPTTPEDTGAGQWQCQYKTITNLCHHVPEGGPTPDDYDSRKTRGIS
ncbi:hypothetical protein DPX16_12540 [Anabarilius grahami]|uniref:Uncharacterized protein n=1 Tax=Anabarilius grahami TaxID=495550 RepID=A0A3N0XR91_ANAGA|nr:hypothetical protein DPX16_12540 [Anabarilius grahami]